MQALGNFGQLDELATQAEAILTLGRARQFDALRHSEVAGVTAILELLGEGGYRSGEPQILAGSRDRRRLGTRNGPLQQPAGRLPRRLVANPQPGQFATLARGLGTGLITQRLQPAFAARRDDLVERSDGVPSADITGIDLVVAEILALSARFS